MSIRRLQGWALIISALCGLLAVLNSDSPAVRVLLIVGTILLILGVPAVSSAQRLGTAGLIGIVLIELAAIAALVFNLAGLAGNASTGETVGFASALAGALGRVIVGWLTTRQRVFPAWAGWAFIVEGVLNLVGGLVASAALAAVLGIVLPLVGAAALLGYGLGLIRPEAAAMSTRGATEAMASKK